MADAGRPIEWTEERKKAACETIFNRIEAGESVRAILKVGERSEDLPSNRLFLEWVASDPILSKQYAYSIEQRAELMADEILSIADNFKHDVTTTEDGREIIDHAVVNRDRLRVDSRKWLMSKMHPKKYGEKLDMTSGNEPIKPALNITVDSAATEETLRKLRGDG